MNKKLLLIDGNSILYRAYYGTAYSRQGILTNSKGLPVNAIMTFGKMLKKYIDNYEPTEIFIAFDAGKNTFRHKKFPNYKATRNKTPEELLVQIPYVKKMVDIMKISRLEMEGWEADDIIGTIAKNNSNKYEILILSSDKDLHQLIDDKVSVIIPQNGNKPDVIYSINNFKEENGFEPHQLIDIKGLLGDSSDNLPGVKGIGIKGSQVLINQFHNLENIYSNIDEITGQLQKKLINDKENAFLSKELATINLKVPLNIRFNDFSWNPTMITSDLINYLKNLELPSLIKSFSEFIEKDKISSKIIF